MPFKKGQSGNPAGKPRGAKDHHPRSAKRAIEKLLENFGNNTPLIRSVMMEGLKAKAPSSFPYLKLIIEQNAGMPKQDVSVTVPQVFFKEYGADR